MKPPHKHFFSSLKQLEKRLKLDDGNPPPPPQQPPQTATQSTEPTTSSPIYIHNHYTTTSPTANDSIEQPPHEFLSINDLTDSQPNPNNPEHNCPQNDAVGGVESMIELLRLTDFDLRGYAMADVAGDEFYEKIVKVKGPKCKLEVERLDRWIEFFLKDGGGLEPLRLAHLLMAKAAVVAARGGLAGGGDVLEFPFTVDEFLLRDPPDD